MRGGAFVGVAVMLCACVLTACSPGGASTSAETSEAERRAAQARQDKPASSPLPEAGRTLLEEDFSAAARAGWQPLREDDVSTGPAAGGWRMRSEVGNRVLWTDIPAPEEDAVEDVRMSVTIAATTRSAHAEDDQDAWGLACRAQPSGAHYELALTSTGRAIIGIEKGAEYVEFAAEQVEGFDPDRSHRLVAACDGEELTLEVDGSTFVAATDDELAAGGLQLFMFSAGPGGEVRFDDLVLADLEV